MVEYTRSNIRKKTPSNAVIGMQPVKEAILSGKTIEKVIIRKGLRGDLFRDLFDLIRKRNIPYQFVPEPKLHSISRKNHQGVIAFTSPVEFQDLDRIVPIIFEKGETPLLLVLDGITDVRNFGAIARSAKCFGVHALVIADKGISSINDVAIKSSAGALLTMDICRVQSLENTLEELKNSGILAVACTEKTETPLWNTDLSVPTALIMGSEESGISESILKLCDHKILIPISGSIESLNVSVSTGIALAEVARQRKNR